MPQPVATERTYSMPQAAPAPFSQSEANQQSNPQPKPAENNIPPQSAQTSQPVQPAAGNKKVFELHGSVHRNYCTECGKSFSPEYIRDSHEDIPRCDTCGGLIKPDVVLYEEGLDSDTLSGAIHVIRQADMMIVAGTSLTVYPAAGLLQYFRGKNLVLINRDATPMDSNADLVIHDKVGQVLGSLR